MTTGAAVKQPLCDYFGSPPQPEGFAQWLQRIDAVVQGDGRGYLGGHHNLHSLYMLHSDPAVRHFYERCDHWYIDGMPVRLILAGFGVRTNARHRFTLMDCFAEFFQVAGERGWRVFYLGSTQEVIDRAALQFADRRFEGLEIKLHNGFFEDDQAVVQEINAYRPDVLLVGMGMPRQEQWLVANLEHLDVAFATHVGASMDYITGAQAKPPLWASRLGLGGLLRLFSDPSRLWRRYLVEPWLLVPLTVRHWFLHRRIGKAGAGQ